MFSTFLCLQGVSYIGHMLKPHGLTRAEAAELLALNVEMGPAFGSVFTTMVQNLVS
jgi:hypothetical protein